MGHGRCNERLKTKTEGSKHLVYTGLCGGRGYLKIETMLKYENYESVRGECEIQTEVTMELSPHPGTFG